MDTERKEINVLYFAQNHLTCFVFLFILVSWQSLKQYQKNCVCMVLLLFVVTWSLGSQKESHSLETEIIQY